MGRTRATVADPTRASRSTRPTMARSARRAEWDFVDPPHRRAVEGSARSLSVVPDLSSAVSAVATDGGLRRRAPTIGGGSPRSRQTGPDGRLYRRQLQLGEKGGSKIGPTKRGKGCKIMAICDGHGLPLAVHLASASPGEVTLVEATLEDRFLADFPTRLIGDKAYDSDPLDQVMLTKWGIDLIARHRDNRRRPPTQDGRPLRRQKRRWKIERLFAWFHNSRRLVVRWERLAENYVAFLHLACARILLRHL